MAKTVKKMPHVFVSEDLSLVEMKFEFESDVSETLRFSMSLFEKVIGRAAQLVTTARSQTLAIGDHLELPYVKVVAATAQAPVGGGKVILDVLGDNGIPMALALSPDLAMKLRRELFRAARSANKQASQSRH